MQSYIVFVSTEAIMLTYGSMFTDMADALAYCKKFKTYCVIYESDGILGVDGLSVKQYKNPIVIKPDNDTISDYERPRPMYKAYYIHNRWWFGSL